MMGQGRLGSIGQDILSKPLRQNRYQLVPAFGFDGLVKPIDSDQPRVSPTGLLNRSEEKSASRSR